MNMERQLTDILEHMAKAHEELSRILRSTRDITMHTAEHLVTTLPDHQPNFQRKEGIMEHALELAGNVTAYLNSLGDLHEALADNLEPVMEQLREQAEEEEE